MGVGVAVGGAEEARFRHVETAVVVQTEDAGQLGTWLECIGSLWTRACSCASPCVRQDRAAIPADLVVCRACRRADLPHPHRRDTRYVLQRSSVHPHPCHHYQDENLQEGPHHREAEEASTGGAGHTASLYSHRPGRLHSARRPRRRHGTCQVEDHAN